MSKQKGARKPRKPSFKVKWKDFTVTWTMIGVAAKSPRAAAEECFKELQESGTPCRVFAVTDNKGATQTIDLDEEEV